MARKAVADAEPQHKKNIKHRQEHHLDPTYNGPLKNRSCTDILCLLLFLVFLASWVALGIYAFSSGSPGEIFAPRDSTNQRCGYDPGMEDKPELIFFDLTTCLLPSGGIFRCDTPQVCIQKCPEENFSFDYYYNNDDVNASFLASKMICTPNAPALQKLTKTDLQKLVTNKTCASYYLQSVQVVHRCLPDLSKFVSAPGDMSVPVDNGAGGKTNATINVSFDAINNSSVVIIALTTVNEFWLEVVRDLNETWPLIIACVVGAVLVSFFYIMIMRWIAGIVIWFSLIASVALLAFASYVTWIKYDELRQEENAPATASMRSSGGLDIDAGQIIRDAIEKQLDDLLRMKNTWLAFFIISVSLLTILAIIIIFLRSRIVLAISLINEGSRAVAHSWSTLFFPIFPWLVQLAVIFYGVAICMFLFSSGVAVYKVTGMQNETNCHCTNGYEDGAFCFPGDFLKYCKNSGDPCKSAACTYAKEDSNSFSVYLQLYNLFIFFWTLFFVGAVGQMILASAFATYYWTFNKSNIPFFVVVTSAWRVIRYHLGTAAFGSLLLAIVSWLRALLEIADHKLKKYDNSFVRAVKCCMRCFFWCLENFLRFLNKNAYIMCAIHGKNFCTSAREAFSLLLRNVIRVFVVDKVTDFLFFISKMVITAGAGVASFYIFSDQKILNFFSTQNTPGELSTVTYSFVPIVFTVIGTYVIASLFFNVYSMAVDTMFLCFLEDCEINDGSQEKPYFMSKNLMRILGRKNKTTE